MSEKDQLFRFVFENTHIRGEIVHLDASFQSAVQYHQYPQPIRILLGQAMAATALLGATIKYEGMLSLQLQGKGPVKLLIVQLSSEDTIRGMVEWDTDYHAVLGAEGEWTLPQLVTDGYMAITVESKTQGDRYQGIVDLAADNLAAALENYFDQSEQLNTRLWLSASNNSAAGLLLQLMPGTEESGLQEEQEDWSRLNYLSGTITEQELQGLPVREILHRLYSEEDVRLFEPDSIRFVCTCSRQRIENMLKGLGYQEVREIFEQEQMVSVECEFCKQAYKFDAVDIEKLFAGGITPQVPRTRH